MDILFQLTGIPPLTPKQLHSASQTVEQEKSSKQWLEQSNLLEQYLIDIKTLCK